MKTNNAYTKTWHLSFIEILLKDLNYVIKVRLQDKSANLCANMKFCSSKFHVTNIQVDTSRLRAVGGLAC